MTSPKTVGVLTLREITWLAIRADVRRMIVTKHKEWGLPVPGEHPAPRRLQHLRWLVSKWAEGTILDPFAGSGTTLLAAKLNGFPAIGIEIEEKYAEIAAKRLAQKVFDFQ